MSMSEFNPFSYLQEHGGNTYWWHIKNKKYNYQKKILIN